MKTKKLKLPDGGYFDLPMPDAFGDALAQASPDTATGQTVMYIVGAVGGAVAGVLIVMIASKIAAAVERR